MSRRLVTLALVLAAQCGLAHAVDYVGAPGVGITFDESGYPTGFPYQNSPGSACSNQTWNGWHNLYWTYCVGNDWHLNGRSSAAAKNGTYGWRHQSVGPLHDSGDVERSFDTAVPSGGQVWVNAWVRYTGKSEWTKCNTPTTREECFSHFLFLNSAASGVGPRINTRVKVPYGTPVQCQPSNYTPARPFLTFIPQTDTHEWDGGTYVQCWNLIDHADEWHYYSFGFKHNGDGNPGTGRIQIYADDAVIFDGTDTWTTHIKGFDWLMMSNFFSDMPDGGTTFTATIDWDDLRITDTRLAMPGGGSGAELAGAANAAASAGGAVYIPLRAPTINRVPR